MIEVIQEDRDAAASALGFTSYSAAMDVGLPTERGILRALAKVFARHRIDTIESIAVTLEVWADGFTGDSLQAPRYLRLTAKDLRTNFVKREEPTS